VISYLAAPCLIIYLVPVEIYKASMLLTRASYDMKHLVNAEIADW